MNKSFSLILIALLGAGCSEPTNRPTVQPQPAPQQQGQANNQIMVPGLSLEIPKEWIVQKVDNQQENVNVVTIKVPDPKYDVTIPMYIIAKTSIGSANKLIKTTESGVKIYTNTCAPALACYKLALGTKLFSVSFGMPSSNEMPPKNVDGPWFPSTTATVAETLSVVSSAASAP